MQGGQNALGPSATFQVPYACAARIWRRRVGGVIPQLMKIRLAITSWVFL